MSMEEQRTLSFRLFDTPKDDALSSPVWWKAHSGTAFFVGHSVATDFPNIRIDTHTIMQAAQYQD